MGYQRTPLIQSEALRRPALRGLSAGSSESVLRAARSPSSYSASRSTDTSALSLAQLGDLVVVGVEVMTGQRNGVDEQAVEDPGLLVCDDPIDDSDAVAGGV